MSGFGIEINNGGGGGGGNDWLLNGNSNGSEKYIGTNDNFDFPFVADGTEWMRLLKTGELAIGSTSASGQFIFARRDQNNFTNAIISNQDIGMNASSAFGAKTDSVLIFLSAGSSINSNIPNSGAIGTVDSNIYFLAGLSGTERDIIFSTGSYSGQKAILKGNGLFGIGSNNYINPFDLGNLAVLSDYLFCDFYDSIDVNTGISIRKDNNISTNTIIGTKNSTWGIDDSKNASIGFDNSNGYLSFGGYPYAGEKFVFNLNYADSVTGQRFVIGSGEHTQDTGGNLYFYGAANSASNSQYNYAAILGLKESNIDVDIKAYLSLQTGDGSGNLVEGIHITSGQETWFTNPIIDTTLNVSIDTNNRNLYYNVAFGNGIGVDYGNGNWYDNAGIISIDVVDRILTDGFNIQSFDYQNRLAIDSSNTNSVDYDGRILYDNNGNIVLLWKDTSTSATVNTPTPYVRCFKKTIDIKSVSTTLLGDIVGKDFIITGISEVLTSETAITVMNTRSIGSNGAGSANNLVASSLVGGTPALNNVYNDTLIPLSGFVPANTSIYYKNTVAATGTSGSLEVSIYGYFR